MAESQPVTTVMEVAATPHNGSIVDGKQTADLPSPTASDKAIVPLPEPPPPSLKPQSLQIAPDIPRPSSGMAIFSTDLGRRPPREPLGPPYEPVIVYSDRNASVVQFAAIWLNKYPRQYHCFFSLCGYTIEDLWDNADIHRHSPAFCKEVL
jgi:hypothetical protein